MSKVVLNASRKWTSARTLAKSEDATNRKGNTTGPVSQSSQQPAAATHERGALSAPAPVQLPQSVFFERQEAVDTLSNLYRNAESVRKIEAGPAAFEARDALKVHDELMECLKPTSGA